MPRRQGRQGRAMARHRERARMAVRGFFSERTAGFSSVRRPRWCCTSFSSHEKNQNLYVWFPAWGKVRAIQETILCALSAFDTCCSPMYHPRSCCIYCQRRSYLYRSFCRVLKDMPDKRTSLLLTAVLYLYLLFTTNTVGVAAVAAYATTVS